VGVAAASCLALVVALNPALWDGEVAGMSRLGERWDRDMAKQQREAGRVTTANTVPEKLALVRDSITDRHEPLRAVLGIGLGPLGLAIGLALLVAGLVRELRGPAAVPPGRAPPGHVPSALLAWIAITAVGTTLWIPIDRARFFLPYLPCMVLLHGLWIAALLRLLPRPERTRPATSAGRGSD
jgi:hypothetical protein